MVDPVSLELLSDAVALVTADDYRKLQVENLRLTRELDEAREENERQAIGSQLLARQVGELEARLAWHKVSDGLPTVAGRYVLRGYDGMWEVLTNWPVDSDLAWPIHALWLGPLPAAPNEAGK